MKESKGRFVQLALALLATGIVPSVHAGLVVGGTRFIFYGQKNAITVGVRNASALPFLVVSKVIPDDGSDTAGSTPAGPGVTRAPFMVTPPLFRLKGGRDSLLRVVRTGGHLPEDRESLFRLSVAGIPESPEKPGANTLEVAVRSKFKFFYRPAGLKGKAEDAWHQISWSRQGASVTVSNPTPYYVTLYNLKVNGHPTDGGMVPPLSSRTQPWCQSGSCSLTWQSINDYGRVMPAWQVSLVSGAPAHQGRAVGASAKTPGAVSPN